MALHNYAKAFDRDKKYIPQASPLPFDHLTVTQLCNVTVKLIKGFTVWLSHHAGVIVVWVGIFSS